VKFKSETTPCTTPNRSEKTTKAEFTRQKLAHMVARGAKGYPKSILSETQGGRPLHFLRVLSLYPFLNILLYILYTAIKTEDSQAKGRAAALLL
jgi:hypothetical protein